MKRFAVLITIVGPILSCMGSPQFHDSFQMDFSATAVCNAQEQDFSFQNSSDKPMTLEGAGITRGTDPLGNFRLVSMTIGSQETSSSNGVITDKMVLPIPPGAIYSFKVNYAPKKVSSEDHATLDISFSDPPGINQIELTGVAPQLSASCPVKPKAGPVAFDGAVNVVVTELDAVESTVGTIISTTQGEKEFGGATLTMQLDQAAGTAVLNPIPPGSFILPKPGNRPGHEADPLLQINITADTAITMSQSVDGKYLSGTGQIILGDPSAGEIHAVIHLAPSGAGDAITADLPVTLTTGTLTASGEFQAVAPYLPNLDGIAPGHVDAIKETLSGSPIDSKTGELVLVGLTNPDLQNGPRIIMSSKGRVRMAVLIKARIESTVQSSSASSSK